MAKGRKTGGRKAGTPNKTTSEIKDAILQAFSDMGGVTYLRGVALSNPQVFCALLGKVLPLTVVGDNDAPPIKQEISFTWQDGQSDGK